MLLVAFSNGCQLTVNEFVELPICHGCTFKLFLEYNLTRFRLICVLWVACTVDCRGSFVQVWPRAT